MAWLLHEGKMDMTRESTQTIARLTYHRIASDQEGGTRFDTVTVTQALMRGAPPAAPFYVSEDGPAAKYRFYTFEPGWIGDWHPAPACQFLALLQGSVEMETTDGTRKLFLPGDLILLQDTSGRGHLTRNVGDGYAMFLVVPILEE